MHPSLRAAAALLLSLLLGGSVVAGTTTSAQAADVFRYWAYFAVEDGEFVAQETGPAGATPDDGAIEAYRYAAPANFEQPNLPRADTSELTFDAVCGEETAEDGEKRVAVLVDYGVEEDADGAEVPEPEALCAVVPEDANGLQTLQAVASDVRTESSSFGPLVCGIGGYPATGCADVKAPEGTPADGEPVDFALDADPASGTSESDAEDDDNSALLLGGIAALVALIVAGGLLLRRRNSAT